MERTEGMSFRVSPEEKATIEAAAEAASQKVSDYMRERALPQGTRAKLTPADPAYTEKRVAQLRAEGLPEHNAKVVALREAARIAAGLPIVKGEEGRGKRGGSRPASVGKDGKLTWAGGS